MVAEENNSQVFDNQLEARWAVFFETLGIKYEYKPRELDTSGLFCDYEPEIFDLPYDIEYIAIERVIFEVIVYKDDKENKEHDKENKDVKIEKYNIEEYDSPTFWLPDMECYIEISKYNSDFKHEKAHHIHNTTGYPCIIFVGMPLSNYGFGYYEDETESSVGFSNGDVEWDMTPDGIKLNTMRRNYVKTQNYDCVEGFVDNLNDVYRKPNNRDLKLRFAAFSAKEAQIDQVKKFTFQREDIKEV